ncbi:type II toxin-antitoxin system PemK/MazF family toxin [Microbacterium sp. SORGH_AS_0888]|uniref:type II toxin-antitoxin system PemK/MazF family toxin n=1 Tax=Microbacterium sp. SORGH_AS_0888 TaxID=3041791 RepID=UPI0027824645|nr:type II toxin-antitoxin system PemK/MazF family toxin [Microbacterium sp. SORGH_AS_0888]MDQ1128561.1 hypothetical protein [Microbacterium sp. SORGH_AS_0888]
MLSLLRRLLFGRSVRGAADAASHTTVEVDPTRVRGLTLEYAPRADGRADAGEIVWTWVPYAERDGRGKDRPVLVLARRDASHVYAVKLTSRSHAGERDFVPIGTGAWDAERRPSWVDLDQLYVVPDGGLRREGAALGREAYARVTAVLGQRYGWRVRR